MFKYLKMINNKLDRFDDWSCANSKRMFIFSVVTITFWMILFSTVFKGWTDRVLTNGGADDYIILPFAYLVTIPIYYLYLKFLKKRKDRKKRNDSCS